MDQAFERLYAAYFGNVPLPWDEFTAAALQYFDNNVGASAAGDRYFCSFTTVWIPILNEGRFEQAEHVWEQALQPVLQWEKAHRGQRIHKGTAYYFWAMTALLRGDIDHGYLLIHQSFDEDTRTSRQVTPNTPSYALVSLNYNEEHQAFRQWVLEQAAFLKDLIANYATTYRRVLTLEDVKRRFFDIPSSLETVFLLTYTIARLRKIAALHEYATNNPFAGQFQLNLLFDVTLVIDAAIKAKNPNRGNFIDLAEHLLAAAGHPLTNKQLGDINGQFKTDFDATLQAALNGTLNIQPNTALDRLQCDVALTYGFRNRGAHNIGIPGTIWEHFDAVRNALFRVFCATIDYLYEKQDDRRTEQVERDRHTDPTEHG